MQKGDLAGVLFCPFRGIQACRLGCSQSITLNTGGPGGVRAGKRQRWMDQVCGPSGWQLQDFKASVHVLGVEWRGAVTCNDLRPPTPDQSTEAWAPQRKWLKVLGRDREAGVNVMLVPSSSGTTPSGALDPCSRWEDFLRSPGHGVMGPGRLMSRDVAG